MKCYKAIEKYFDENGDAVNHLCGYGYCSELEEVKSEYKAGIIITEISETELQDLRQKQHAENEKSIF